MKDLCSHSMMSSVIWGGFLGLNLLYKASQTSGKSTYGTHIFSILTLVVFGAIEVTEIQFKITKELSLYN